MSEKATRRVPDPLPRTARELGEIKRTLQGIEARALSDVASVLSETAESLARTAKDLADMRPVEWLTPEQAAIHLGCKSVEAFEKIAAREGIPKHYLSARAPRYNRGEVDAWLTGRQGATRGSNSGLQRN